jgi:hypothetical protein
MRLAVLILVSSFNLFCSLPIKPESKCFRVNIQNISIAIVVNIVSLWMFEQKWFAITERIKAKPIKKILMFF